MARYEAPGIKLEIFGDVLVRRELLRFAGRGDDLRPVFNELAYDFNAIETAQFDTQGQRGSGGWAPLAPSTIARKEKAGLDPRILHATLAMRNSLTRRGARGSVRTVRRDQLILGTRIRSVRGFPYPAAHQNPGRAKHPRRPPVALTDEDRRRWVKAVQRFLVTGEVPGRVGV